MPTTADFLRENPTCCFCGGGATATTEDHVPPRALFARKEWPEGYVFPACVSCNAASREADQLVALFGRMSFTDPHVIAAEFEKLLGGVRNTIPGGEPILESDTEESRELFKALDAALPNTGHVPPGTPRVAIDAEVFLKIDPVFRKIFSALHYKHVGQIVPKTATIFRMCTTNQLLDSDDPYEWQRFPHFQSEPIIRRNGKTLHDQFDYKWGLTHNPDMFGLSFHLRTSLFGVLIGPVADKNLSEFQPRDLIPAWIQPPVNAPVNGSPPNPEKSGDPGRT